MLCFSRVDNDHHHLADVISLCTVVVLVVVIFLVHSLFSCCVLSIALQSLLWPIFRCQCVHVFTDLLSRQLFIDIELLLLLL